MRNRKRKRKKEFTETPDARSYVHHRCGVETVVGDESFSGLCNPFRIVLGTFCVECNRMDRLSAYSWADSGERISKYRKRLLRQAPVVLQIWFKGLGSLIGMLFGAAIGWIVASDARLIGLSIGAAIGLLGFTFYLTPIVVPLIMRTDYRRKV